MLNQSFTVSNFRKIFDYENRKGCYLEGRYYPEIESLTKELKNCATEFKILNKEKDQILTEDYEHRKSQLNSKKKQIKEKKEKLLIDELEKLCEQINKGEYSINIIKTEATQDNKASYSIEKSNICAYFIIKQVQYTLKKIYKVQQSNRYNIICQLRGVLNNSFPKYIVCADIKEFYESISQEKLLKKINKDSLLMPSSKKIIHAIISEYNNLSGTTTGIPRGISISAYLSELYMREFDEAIKKHPDIIFYARYVDDIVVIYSPKPNSDTSNFLDKIREEAGRLDLSLNENQNKTKEIDLTTSLNGNFEYLGYKFIIESGKVKIEISNNKINRYKKRIESSFNEYIQQNPTEKSARKLLIDRLRFLTGNTRLSNNKDNALIGIYFTNNLLTNSSCLVALDYFLKNKIDGTSMLSERVKNRLLKMTFQSGWNQKRFHHFSINEIQEIVKVWKNAP